MDAEYANYYTREVMLILIREFQSPDEEMKKIVLKVRQNDSLALILNMYVFPFLKIKSKKNPNQRNKSNKTPPQITHRTPHTELKLLDFYFLSGGKAVLWYGWC